MDSDASRINRSDMLILHVDLHEEAVLLLSRQRLAGLSRTLVHLLGNERLLFLLLFKLLLAFLLQLGVDLIDGLTLDVFFFVFLFKRLLYFVLQLLLLRLPRVHAALSHDRCILHLELLLQQLLDEARVEDGL